MNSSIPPKRARETALLGLGAVTMTLGVAAVLLMLGGYDPVQAAAAMLRGSVGSWNTFVSITLVRAVPLLFAGLAVALAFRAGVWNIGAEGQLYVGAVAGVWVALTFTDLPGPFLVTSALTASVVAGGAWALVPALMKLRLGIGEVITTILMNFVGIYLAAWMVHGPLQERRGVFPQTDRIVDAARLPELISGTRLHLGFALALVLAGMLAFVLQRTRFGFHLRAVGASPAAAVVAGRIDTNRVILLTFLASGAIAGLAGGVEVTGLTYALYEDLSDGWGYTAIAVALLGGLRPGGVIVTAIFFGALQAGAGAMQRDAGIPAAWVDVVEALVILAVLGLDRIRAARVGHHAGEEAL
ncbi:MAG TPA: ABC transporter permease [Gemmatimonadetes bacterium]|nr:sugar ABC transporter permease [Gemmatimonadota bacterium]HBV05857.1 ABC transporter permease [Gemmatimonadota bacterium]